MRPAARNSVALAMLVLALFVGRAMAADELGTLFTTPAERARLDRLRRGEPVTPPTEAGVVSRHKPSITGYVQRSDGRNTVWIDGRPVVLASPGKALEPGIVRPQSSDPVLRVQPKAEPDR
jgi:hypothetical protein